MEKAPGLDLQREIEKQRNQNTQEKQKADLEKQKVLTQKVASFWPEVDRQLRLSRRGIEQQIKIAALKGKTTIDKEEIWGVGESGTQTPGDFFILNGDALKELQQAYTVKFNEWFKSNISPDLSAEMDRNGNVVLTWNAK